METNSFGSSQSAVARVNTRIYKYVGYHDRVLIGGPCEEGFGVHSSGSDGRTGEVNAQARNPMEINDGTINEST